MIRNCGEPAETDTTDCSCMELYSRNSINKYHQNCGNPKPNALRGHQSHPRVNGNCANRCFPAKRKPGNPKQLQHCPSCLCPPNLVRSSPGRLRVTQELDDILNKFEEKTKNPRDQFDRTGAQPTSSKVSNPQGKYSPSKSSPKKSSSSGRQARTKGDSDDRMLNALYQDLMSSGLAPDDQVQGFNNGRNLMRPPIKSIRYKSGNNVRRETSSSQLPGNNHESVVDIDSDDVLQYFRDYKNLKNSSAPAGLSKSNNAPASLQSKEDDGDNLNKGEEEDDDRLQFERDKRELNELGQEVKEFEMKKGRELRNRVGPEDSQWDRQKQQFIVKRTSADSREKTRPNDDGDYLTKRKVTFLPTKLPVPLYGTGNSRSPRSPRHPVGNDAENVGVKITGNGRGEPAGTVVETRDFTPLKPATEEYSNENYNQECLEYFKEPRDSFSQELKDISYSDVPPCRCASAPSSAAPQPIINDKADEKIRQNIIKGNGVQVVMRQGGATAVPGEIGISQDKAEKNKKYIYTEGDLDLHASKSYIVDLIDRALSRELGTLPDEKKVGTTISCPSQSQKEICVEIARALQSDYNYHQLSNYGQNSSSSKESPDYVRHLKVLRWDYLNHIQDELRKLQDLERILDTYSPRQSPSLHHLQSQTSNNSSDQRSSDKNHQAIIP